MELAKLPVPVPSVVLLFAIVGPVLIFQHTPWAVMVAPPSSVMLPPEVAVVWVITDAAVVVRVAMTGGSVLIFLQEVNNKTDKNGNSSFFMLKTVGKFQKELLEK